MLTTDVSGDNFDKSNYNLLSKSIREACMEEVDISAVPSIRLRNCDQNGALFDFSALPKDYTVNTTLELYKEQETWPQRTTE